MVASDYCLLNTHYLKIIQKLKTRALLLIAKHGIRKLNAISVIRLPGICVKNRLSNPKKGEKVLRGLTDPSFPPVLS
jgi:hypothetical protein